MNTPPIGTKCVDCGCCPATIYAGNAAICWECDAGEPCKTKVARASAPAAIVPVPAPKPIQLPAPAPPAPRQEPTKEKPVNNEPKRKGGRVGRISDEVKQRIINADVNISNCELARQVGISEPSVRLIRLKAGIMSAATLKARGLPKMKPGPKSAKTKAIVKAAPAKDATRALAARVRQEGHLNTLRIQLTNGQMERLWETLGPGAKALALEAAIAEQMKQL